MHAYVAGTSMLMTGGAVVLGVVAVRTGWLLPWLRRSRIQRPALWGYGAMLTGTGVFLLTAGDSSDAFHSTPVLQEALWFTGVPLIVAGGWFQLLSARERLDT
ncbi:hypothetical protein AB0945_22790 [Streptomyces sp. NPDC005474]|uniref:hypothetical protein n=1 Tax=Streptomyces sp. NPDC005474 TaxID=3154878 RepID=UPI003454F9CF